MSVIVEQSGKHASGMDERHLQAQNIDEALLLWMRELRSPPEYNKFQSAYFYAKRRLGDEFYQPTQFPATSSEERTNVAKYIKAYYADLITRSQDALVEEEEIPPQYAEEVPEGVAGEQIVPLRRITSTPDQGEFPDEKFARVVGGEKLWDDYACDATEPSEYREDRIHGFWEKFSVLEDYSDEAYEFVACVETLMHQYRTAFGQYCQNVPATAKLMTLAEWAQDAMLHLEPQDFPSEAAFRLHVFATGRIAGLDTEACRNRAVELWNTAAGFGLSPPTLTPKGHHKRGLKD